MSGASARSRNRPVLKLAHSPDPDDAFMWWPLFALGGNEPHVASSSQFQYEPVTADIESLNERAEQAEYEITAISCAQYPNVADRYAITACGASMGDAYGPKLVGGPGVSIDRLREPGVTVAVPGTRTSAFAALNLLLGKGAFKHAVVAFDQIIDAVAAGDVDAGVVIHEGQLTFENAGLVLIEDLGRWWSERYGGPLPLGLNVVRRDLDSLYGPGSLEAVADDLLRSVEHALEHREQSVEYAMQFARGMDSSLADEFIHLYVNRWTLDFGEQGRAAVGEFLGACSDAGLTPRVRSIDFVSPRGSIGAATAADR